MTPESPPRPDPVTAARASARSRDRRYRRRIWLGLAISAAVHVAAVLLYPRLFGALPVRSATGEPDTPPPPTGTEVVNLVELTTELQTPPEPQREPEIERPAPPVTEQAPELEEGAEAEEEEGENLTAAQRLQPSTNDERLWAPLPEEITALTREQQIRNLLYARLQTLNDSARVQALRALASQDWTFTDEEGNRWGISPGRLHLGPITLPLPSFGAPAGASDDLRRVLDIEAEIRRAAGLLEAWETNEERARAIRERKDAERRNQPPDTTRGGGGGGR